MDDSLHYMIMANQMLVQKALLEQLKDTGLTIGQPKILDYLKEHDGSNQKEIANAVESIPLTNATAVARAATKAECELGIPPEPTRRSARNSFFVTAYRIVFMI